MEAAAAAPLPDLDRAAIPWQDCSFAVRVINGYGTPLKTILFAGNHVLVFVKKLASCVMGKIYKAHCGHLCADGSVNMTAGMHMAVYDNVFPIF